SRISPVGSVNLLRFRGSLRSTNAALDSPIVSKFCRRWMSEWTTQERLWMRQALNVRQSSDYRKVVPSRRSLPLTIPNVVARSYCGALLPNLARGFRLTRDLSGSLSMLRKAGEREQTLECGLPR